MLDASSTALIDLLKNALAVTHPDFENQIPEELKKQLMP